MKRLYLLFFAIALLAACGSRKERVAIYTDLFRANLKGDIHFIQDSMMIMDSGRIVPDSVTYKNEEYKSGYLDNTLTTDSSQNNRDSTVYTHYDNGLLKSVEIYSNGKSLYSLVMHLDSAGHRYSTADAADTSGAFTRYRELRQNEYGQLISGSLYHGDNSLLSSFADRYEKQHLTGHTVLDSTGHLDMRITYTLDKNGNPLEEIRLLTGNERGASIIRKYTYDSYDKKGNWSQRTEWKEGQPVKTVIRKFVYNGE